MVSSLFRLTAGATLALLLGVLPTTAWAVLDVNKSFTPISIRQTQSSVVEVRLFNSSQSFAVNDVVFTDILPTNVTIASATPLLNECGGMLTLSDPTRIVLSGGTIPVGVGGNSGSCRIQVQVTSATAGTYVNQIDVGEVTGVENGVGIANPQAAQATLIVNPILALTGIKRYSANCGSPETAALHVGGVSPVCVRLTNPNVFPVTGVALTDALPVQMVLNGTGNLRGTCLSGGGTPVSSATSAGVTGATLAAGGSCDLVFDITVDPAQRATVRNANVNNTVPASSVTSNEGATNTAFNRNLLVQTGAAGVKSFSPATVPQSGTSTLTIQLRNFNDLPITGAALTDAMPTGITVLGPVSTDCVDGTASFTATSVSISGATIPPAPSLTTSSFGACSITATVRGDQLGVLNNGVDAGNWSGIPYNTFSGNLTVVSAVSASKVFAPAVRPQGTTSTATITLSNSAGLPAAITAFTDDFNMGVSGAGPGLTITGTSNTCGGTVNVGGTNNLVVSMGSGTIPAGGSCTITVNLAISATAGIATRTNTIAANALQTSLGNNATAATATLQITRAATLGKTFSPTSVASSGISRLTVTVTRDTALPAFSAVQFTDPLPAGLTIAATPNLVNTCEGSVTATPGGNVLALSGGSVAGASCSVAVDVQSAAYPAPPAACPSYVNTIPTANFSVSDGSNGYNQGANVSATLATVDADTGAAGCQSPSLLINKAFDPITTTGGGFSTAIVQIANNQPAAIALSNVSLTDVLPANVTVFGPTSATFTASSGTCSGGSITAVPGADRFSISGASIAANSVCELRVRVTSTFDGNHINEIVTGALSSREGVSNSNTVSATLTIQRNINVQKFFTPRVIPVGGISQLTLRVFNSNEAVRTLTPAGLVDTLPGGMTIAATPAASTTCAGATLTAPAGGNTVTLGSFALAARSFCDVLVPVTVATANSFVNTIAAGVIQTAEGSTNPDIAQDTLISVAQPSIAKAFAPASVALGGTSTITFTLTNASALAPLTAASFSDALPTGMRVHAGGAAGGTCVGASSNVFTAGQTGTLNFTGLTVPNTGGRTCTVTLAVSTTTTGAFPNQATNFRSTETPTGVDSPVATLTVLGSPPSINKAFVPASVPLGTLSTLTLTLSNASPVPVTLASPAFTDPFPAGMTVASPLVVGNTCGGTLLDAAGATLVAGATGVRLNGGSIPADGSCTLTLAVVTSQSGNFPNTTSVLGSTNAGSSTIGGSATLTVTPPELSVAKSVFPNPVATGGQATYTIVVSNAATVGTGRALAPLRVDDSLPVGMTLVATTGSDPGWSCAGTTDLVCTYANDIAAGASTTLRLVVNVDLSNVTGDNTARVSGGRDPLCPAPPELPAARCSGSVLASTVPVVLSQVEARVIGGELVVGFATSTELGTAAFRVLAGPERGSLGAALPSAAGTRFDVQTYEVRGPDRGQREVWIEELDLLGGRTVHGPFPVGTRVGTPEAPSPIDWAAIAAEQQAFRSQAAGALRNTTAAVVELRVDSDGWYQLRHEDLLAAGIDWSGTAIAELRLRTGESMVPIEVHGPASFGPGSRVAFYGRGITDSLYTRSRVYTLDRVGGGERLQGVQATPHSGAPQSVIAGELRHAPDRLYSMLSPGSDPWYAREARRVGETVTAAEESFVLPGRAAVGLPDRLEVLLWGGSDPVESPDHSARILVNGTFVGAVRFEGLSTHRYTVDLPPGLLQSGNNVLRIEPVADTDAGFDVIALESIRVDYPRTLSAVDNRLSFAVPESLPTAAAAERIRAEGFEAAPVPACTVSASCLRYRVSGLSTPEVVILRERAGVLTRLDHWTLAGTSGNWSADFAVALAPGDRIHLEPAAGRVPRSIQPVVPVADPLAGGPASYLILSHPAFIGSLTPLIAARQAEGFTVRVLDVESLYRAYGDGRFDPEPIRRAIAEAYARLGTRYVLLVGGDTYDYLDHGGIGAASFLPTFYRQTDARFVRFGAADSVHADIDRDGVADLALGRFPARTAAEAAALVNKTLDYASASHGRRHLLVADRPDPLVFADQLRQIVPQLPGWTPTEVDLGQYPVGDAGTAAARGAMVAAVNQGQALVTYLGHSSPSRWTFSGLLNAAQVSGGLFANPTRPTVIWTLGCYGSTISQPVHNSLAHAFLLRPQGGAAVVLGASGLTTVSSDVAWLNTMLLYLPQARIGDALWQSQQLLHGLSPDYRDIVVGANLLGDPALRLRQ
ncbi:MAG: C25 family cysteine peptidase [Xanthomonadales bacterium]|jgi:uncharacterized repeat protein (TIGR01451 family)|nr:C25 family cysteine peptidase [Xanthomonadales bacterium]